MKKYITITVEAAPEKKEIIAALLMDAGFLGTDDSGDRLTASIGKDDFNQEAIGALLKEQDATMKLQEVEEQNWNEQWEQSFEPVEVEDFAVIRASFHAPVEGFEHEIIITPKMSFGTGHHATTHLVIAAMRQLDFAGKKVIDFGTGTAVLAILAEKLGAAEIIAIDNDEWSINNSLENVEANNCNKIQTLLANEMPAGEATDIILANINYNVIIANLPAIRQRLTNGGFALFSGLLSSDEVSMTEALQAHGFQVKKVDTRNGWIAILTSITDYPQS